MNTAKIGHVGQCGHQGSGCLRRGRVAKGMPCWTCPPTSSSKGPHVAAGLPTTKAARRETGNVSLVACAAGPVRCHAALESAASKSNSMKEAGGRWRRASSSAGALQRSAIVSAIGYRGGLQNRKAKQPSSSSSSSSSTAAATATATAATAERSKQIDGGVVCKGGSSSSGSSSSKKSGGGSRKRGGGSLSRKAKQQRQQQKRAKQAARPTAAPRPSSEEGGPTLMDTIAKEPRRTYKAAGLLPFTFLEDGRMAVLLSRREAKDTASKRTLFRCQAFNFLGGKRKPIDLGPEDTALREVYEETAGLISGVREELTTAVWMPSSKYLVYLLDMSSHRDLPLVFALWRAQGNSCWGGVSTQELRWLPLEALLDPKLDPSWKQHPVLRLFLWDRAAVRWLKNKEREQMLLRKPYNNNNKTGGRAAEKNNKDNVDNSNSGSGSSGTENRGPGRGFIRDLRASCSRQGLLPWQTPPPDPSAGARKQHREGGGGRGFPAKLTSLSRPWQQPWQGGEPLRISAVVPPAPGPPLLPVAWWLAQQQQEARRQEEQGRQKKKKKELSRTQKRNRRKRMQMRKLAKVAADGNAGKAAPGGTKAAAQGKMQKDKPQQQQKAVAQKS